MDYIEKTVKANYIFKGKILSLRCDDAELPDGKPCSREFIEHGGGACVLYVKDGKQSRRLLLHSKRTDM